MTDTEFDAALTRIQMEYVEMPELKLTLVQARRMWSLPVDLCEAAMTTLVAAGFLMKTRDGAFLRRGSPPVSVHAVDGLTWVLQPDAPAVA